MEDLSIKIKKRKNKKSFHFLSRIFCYFFTFSDWINAILPFKKSSSVMEKRNHNFKRISFFLETKHDHSEHKSIVVLFELGVKLTIVSVQAAETSKKFFFGSLKTPFISQIVRNI